MWKLMSDEGLYDHVYALRSRDLAIPVDLEAEMDRRGLIIPIPYQREFDFEVAEHGVSSW